MEKDFALGFQSYGLQNVMTRVLTRQTAKNKKMVSFYPFY
jgi:hypothetical protein